MRVSALDEQLGDILRPLVEMKAVMRVAPFVNTLCLGLHYHLAQARHSRSNDRESNKPSDRLGIADWNRTDELIGKSLFGIFMFYSSKRTAQKCKEMGIEGLVDSAPVTRFRQRFAFLIRNASTEQFASAVGGKLCAEFFEQAAHLDQIVRVHTDIVSQAETLMDAAMQQAEIKPEVICIGRNWPMMRSSRKAEIPLLVYSGPSTAYMRQLPDRFIPLEVDDALITSAPQYETHIIWHVPDDKTDLVRDIRVALTEYHRVLFEAAGGAGDEDFAAMCAACNDVLGEQHPSFPADTFRDPKVFRRCLSDHHSQPQAARRKQSGAP